MRNGNSDDGDSGAGDSDNSNNYDVGLWWQWWNVNDKKKKIVKSLWTQPKANAT